MIRRSPLPQAVLLTFAFVAATSYAADWPQWRGPERNGISQETGLLNEWPDDGPKLLWQRTDLGDGYSTPAVVGDRLYLLGSDGIDNEFVQALDVTQDGKQIWRTRIGKVGEPDQQAALSRRPLHADRRRRPALRPRLRRRPRLPRRGQPATSAGRRTSAPTSAASPASGPTPSRRWSTATSSSSPPAARDATLVALNKNTRRRRLEVARRRRRRGRLRVGRHLPTPAA